MLDVDQSCSTIETVLLSLRSRGPMLPTAIFARAAAHGLKNRLNPLSLQLALLRRRTDDDATSELVDALTASLRELDQMLDMAQRFGQRIAPPQADDDALAEALHKVEQGLLGKGSG